ncbi:putative major head subunit [Brachyspira pilosicoli WesB]|uniref:Putative major head subunit n=1 Tax=Brachyspira pilosicoli WesB TaxID=1161918 RepID=K0JF42_BRAPL|nr:Mu-like prophage major head subunit gpT family protein [Brachyspira pilosicoli]CCG55798.1 putative major head subunit [Brachyspira pilosicoli WesB]
MPITADEKLKSLKTIIKHEFNDGYGKLSPDSFYNKTCTLIPSNTASNTYDLLGDFPEFKEWVSQRQVKDMKEHSYTVNNKNYEATLGVKVMDLENDNLGTYKIKAARQAEAAIDFFNESAANLLKAGESTLCYDGQNFFDNEHPVYANADGTGDNTPVSNIYGTGSSQAWYLLDLSKSLKPLIMQQREALKMEAITNPNSEYVFTNDAYMFGSSWRGAFCYGFWQQALMSKADLTSDNFEKAYAQMRKITKDGGRKMGIKATHIVIPPDLQSKAEAIFNVANNEAGAGNINYKKVEIIVCDWL